MRFACWMSRPWGRGIRIVGGLGLIATGLWWVEGGLGWGLAGFGLLPIATGAFNLCPISPFMGLPLRSSKLKNC